MDLILLFTAERLYDGDLQLAGGESITATRVEVGITKEIEYLSKKLEFQMAPTIHSNFPKNHLSKTTFSKKCFQSLKNFLSTNTKRHELKKLPNALQGLQLQWPIISTFYNCKLRL